MKNPNRLCVLYLEDDADTREMVTFMLAMSNIDVVTAETAERAWELVNERSFDLYLLDGQKPSDDSFEFCRNLKQFAPEIPIVIYSGRGYKSDIQDGLDAGAIAYLVKPYFGDLSAIVLETIEHSKHPHIDTVVAALSRPDLLDLAIVKTPIRPQM